MEKVRLKAEPQVTALIVFEILPGRTNDFEEWLKDVNQVVKVFEGYKGVDIIRPRDHDHPEYVIILRFEHYHHLKAWTESSERAEWLKKSEEMMATVPSIQEAHGFDPWFTLPEHVHDTVTPSKFKMSVVTIVALYPPLLLLSTLLSALFPGWPKALLLMLSVLILVPTMSYLIMPWMTRLFRGWLYPKT